MCVTFVTCEVRVCGLRCRSGSSLYIYRVYLLPSCVVGTPVHTAVECSFFSYYLLVLVVRTPSFVTLTTLTASATPQTDIHSSPSHRPGVRGPVLPQWHGRNPIPPARVHPRTFSL